MIINKKGLKNFLARCFVSGGGYSLGRRRNARRLIVLYYHRVVTDDQPIDENLPGMFVRAREFERQVEWLTRHYHPVSADDLLNALQGQALPDYSVLITFDDGYKDNLTLAQPILTRYQVPWLLFATTGFIDNELSPWFDTLFLLCQRLPDVVVNGRTLCCHDLRTPAGRKTHCQLFHMLSAMDHGCRQTWLSDQLAAHGVSRETLCAELFCRWSDLRSLGPSVTFGGHTHSHPCLARLTENQAMAEIIPARDRLARLLGHDITLFAYPTGRRHDFTDQTASILKRHHFACAFTTLYGLSDPAGAGHDDRFRLPRIGIDAYDSLAAFKMKISGGWQRFAR